MTMKSYWFSQEVIPAGIVGQDDTPENSSNTGGKVEFEKKALSVYAMFVARAPDAEKGTRKEDGIQWKAWKRRDKRRS
ncbi:UNVERIFIED_CONTAM: hypothetical protein HHA_200595 [Hammondia hammondi]|eukprot:XP_008888741.1 hypothetical protein HHA_200595 [Hammondia hammondi]